MATIATAVTETGSESAPHFLFGEEHEIFRRTIRQFIEREVNPHAEEWEAAGRVPVA